MAKKHVFNIGPVRGVGASAKAAKDDAIITAASILGSDHTPVLVRYRDETRLAVRDENLVIRHEVAEKKRQRRERRRSR